VVSLGVTHLYKDTDHPLPIAYLLGQTTMVEETIVKGMQPIKAHIITDGIEALPLEEHHLGVGLGAVAEECHASLFITAARQEFQYVQQ